MIMFISLMIISKTFRRSKNGEDEEEFYEKR